MLTREEKKHAIARVRQDGAIPLSDLSQIVNISEPTLRNWIVRGIHNVHLDAIVSNDPKQGRLWFSSVSAWERFCKLVSASEQAARLRKLRRESQDHQKAG